MHDGKRSGVRADADISQSPPAAAITPVVAAPGARLVVRLSRTSAPRLRALRRPVLRRTPR